MYVKFQQISFDMLYLFWNQIEPLLEITSKYWDYLLIDVTVTLHSSRTLCVSMRIKSPPNNKRDKTSNYFYMACNDTQLLIRFFPNNIALNIGLVLWIVRLSLIYQSINRNIIFCVMYIICEGISRYWLRLNFFQRESVNGYGHMKFCFIYIWILKIRYF